jgi:DAK2 domain fusion protein YloV
MSEEPETTLTHQVLKSYRDRPIDGASLKALVEAGLTWLRTNQQMVNALNVFPVPDGDTGTNMVLTMQSALDEISLSSERNFGKMAHAVAHGALMGARGNSGVILSQIWRGFARSVDDLEVLDAASMVQAFIGARDTAYKGVVRPVEGTILTVIKDIAAAAEDSIQHTTDPFVLLEDVVRAADASVQHTPELLPVLKEAGVVDAGGKGLYFMLEGMLRLSYGQSLDTPHISVQPLGAMILGDSLETIEPDQDYEVVVDFRPSSMLELEGFYQTLEEMGTSIQVGEGDGIYRMHIHVPAEKMYDPITYTLSLGTVTKVAIENLIDQMESLQKAGGKTKLTLSPIEPGQIAVVVVSPGPGIARIFASLGAAAIVEGGQTMNPSTQEIIHAFENLPTDKVVILPNNKNIIMAAKSAAELTVKRVHVVPSKTIPQGLAAMFRLAPQGDLERVVKDMTGAIEEVETGEITIATRSVEIDGVVVKEGQVIALHNGKMILAAETIEDACLGFLKSAHADDFEIITLYSGEDITRQELNRITDLIRRVYPSQEIEHQEGGQPHYQFIISIE